jgi:hypothetical protein
MTAIKVKRLPAAGTGGLLLLTAFSIGLDELRSPPPSEPPAAFTKQVRSHG